MKPLSIALFNLRRLFRDRSNIFFVIILPLVLILVLGSVFGGIFTPKLAIHDAADDDRSRQIIAALEEVSDLDIDVVGSDDAVIDAVSRGTAQAGMVIPADLSNKVRLGEPVSVQYFGRQDSLAPQLRSTVNAVIARQSAVLRAARFASTETGIPLDQATTQAESVLNEIPALEVELSTVGEDLIPDSEGFDSTASAMLLLFVFLTSLTGSMALIETRSLGVSRRMISTPTSAGTVLLGEMLGRYAVALTQGLIVMAGSALLFGVNWGDPLAAAVLLVLFALVGAGAGMLVGSVLSNEQQALAVGLGLGLGGAAIGGSMVPLEIFPDTLRTIAHIMPHAWGNDAFSTLLRDNGAIGDIATELGVLAAYAAGLLLAASWIFRRRVSAG